MICTYLVYQFNAFLFRDNHVQIHLKDNALAMRQAGRNNRPITQCKTI